MLRDENMHSRKKVRQFYPWIADALPALYANPMRNASDGRVVDRNSKLSLKQNHKITQSEATLEMIANDERFANLNMTEFLVKTVPETQVIYCLYHNKNCQSEWTYKLTLNGFCIVYNKDTGVEPKPKISVGRQTSLTLMLGFNDSDVGGETGWWASFEGFTVFYSEPNEDTIDPIYSIGSV